MDFLYQSCAEKYEQTIVRTELDVRRNKMKQDFGVFRAVSLSQVGL